MIGFNNGKYQELSEITIPIMSLSINRGYGAFEFLEVINRKPFFGDRHAARFQNTMKVMKLKTEFDDRLNEIIAATIDRNDLENYFMKLFVLPHESMSGGLYLGALYLCPAVMKPYNPSLYSVGAHLIMKQFDRFLPAAKSTNYLFGQYWLDEQTDPRVTDILFHNGETVQETSRGNVFIVKDGAVVTPAKNILKGVTRELVLELLAEMGILHAEAPVRLPMLLSADEVFLTSTTKHLMPITQIDDTKIGDGKPGEITRKVMQEFQKLVDQY
ncbi:MAG TPA: aminotransferase class IV [Sunxiuqinia sp.]|nr:aminotransferase class IV [Sunxiuqinia sp.]